MTGATAFAANDEMVTLGNRIAETAASLDAGIYRLLTDVRRFDRERGWAHDGALSCAHWLSWRCGIALGAGREKVRVAHALAELPILDEALRLGQLSYSKVRAMTRVATPENEYSLAEIGRHSTAAQLERVCRLYAQTQPKPKGVDAPERWLRVRETPDGMVRIEAQLRPEEAARILEAAKVSAETREDGLVAMAEAVLRGDRPDRPAVEVMVHVDANTLTGHQAEAGIPAETARRLLCDAGIVPVLEDAAGTPLDVGRKTRVIPTAIRRALIARDESCRFPSCTNRLYTDAHHLVHWVDGGATSLSNTALLCSTHHVLVHEGGFQAIGDGNDVRFFAPSGVEIGPAGIPPKTPADLVPVSAATTVWDSEPVDYDSAVWCLAPPEDYS
jgi:Domain of unknown function (DUF222)